jgi:DNA-binding MarR family transcriptional regulator
MRDRAIHESAALPLDSTLDFMRLLWSVQHHLQSTSKMMESRLGITGPQRLVLRVVARSPGISPTELATVLRLHPSTITGVLQRLSKKGLLLRARDPIDTRRVRLRALPSARRYIRPATGTVEHAVERALKRLSAEAVHSAREVLAAIATAFESANAG